MAFEKMETVYETEVGKELLRVSNGAENVDIRRYYKDENDEWAPSKKGVRVNKENLYELVQVLAGLLEENEIMDLADYLNSDGPTEEDAALINSLNN